MQEPSPAKLVIISGILTGQVFPLESTTTTFGRDASNTIGVPDAALSRLHCVFSLDREGWNVRDVGSSNGTFVNGQKIERQVLAEGDRISAGGCVLLFAREPIALGSIVAFDEDAALLPTTSLALRDAAYLDPLSAVPALHAREQHLQALLAISTAIHAVRDEGQLGRELLDLLFKALPAAEGAILRPGLGAALDIQAVRPDSGPGVVHVHAETVRRAISEDAGILCAATGSITSSVLAVPLSVPGRTLGAIYLTSRGGHRFTDEHLELATAVARISAIAIDNLRQRAALERETDRLQADLHFVHRMVGDSDALRQVEGLIAKVARVDTTVLITGETGTGKELAARAIHLRSGRARRPFVAINCAALTESLLESELFGHERGAFTGAIGQKKGKIELAEGGTVFLDEVGELAPGIQSKLLRVLQQRELERVGGTHPIAVDVRILSATNRDLDAGIASGTFRSDLYYRLNVVSIHVPPLRERREDIPRLARHFLSLYAPKSGRAVTSISSAAMERMLDYEWPGNIRELENAIERACVIGSSEQILQEDLPETLIDSATASQVVAAPGLHACVLEAKRQAVIAAFRQSGGNYTETARLLGIHPNYLHRLVRALHIKATLEEA